MRATVGVKTPGKGQKGAVKAMGTYKVKNGVAFHRHHDRPAAGTRVKARSPIAHESVRQVRSAGGSYPVDAAATFVGVLQARNRLGLTQPEFGRVIGCSTRSVAGWEADAATVKPLTRRRVVEVDRLGEALGQLMPAGAVGSWLKMPNPAFEGQTPLQVIERGESDRLWHMIHQIDAGVAN